MARKRKPKQTEQAPVTLKELPRSAEELTSAEAEAAKGGFIILMPRKIEDFVGDNDITDEEYWNIR